MCVFYGITTLKLLLNKERMFVFMENKKLGYGTELGSDQETVTNNFSASTGVDTGFVELEDVVLESVTGGKDATVEDFGARAWFSAEMALELTDGTVLYLDFGDYKTRRAAVNVLSNADTEGSTPSHIYAILRDNGFSWT